MGRKMTEITDHHYRTMFNKLFVFSLLISAVTAELKEGLYRILDPEINSIGYVAKSGYEVGTPASVTLTVHVVSNHGLARITEFFSDRYADQTDAHM
jgi:hypothetical protein